MAGAGWLVSSLSCLLLLTPAALAQDEWEAWSDDWDKETWGEEWGQDWKGKRGPGRSLIEVPRETADRAIEKVQPGSLIVHWTSNRADRRPTLFRVESAGTEQLQEGRVCIILRVRPVASSVPGVRPGPAFVFQRARSPGVQQLVLNLAYVYVRSNELKDTFVCLAKSLGLECQVRWPAIEVPPPAPEKTEGPARAGVNERLGDTEGAREPAGE